ncbi:hypothetical protein SAMN05443572_101467 [Myxococcus fulvus]|uniref:Uncharacterized protein n=1 Tax=Myxococcus fulvus TaxID=33 RepID=A0A511T2D7_MYXFU|nr:hypothetical protein [Myxococcus fulvus]GEN07518.1 hypothetical protein MFU01_25550 [Myxococcus fulvus]SES88319.1 hypothetical protein SAMN05443572_101467 [Myxococcus fulvus]
MADAETLDRLGREVSFEELAERFKGHDMRDWLLENRTLVSEEPKPRLIEGSLQVDHDLETGDGPWVLVIDGDLVTTGDLVCTTDDYAVSTLFITGQLRARNIRFQSSARVSVDGDVVVSGVIVGTGGDSEASLGTSSTLTARAVVLDSNTAIWAKAGQPRSVPEAYRTLIVGGKGWQSFIPDVDVGDPSHHQQTFVPEVIRGGVLDAYKTWSHVRTGGGPLLPEVEQALRQKKGL